MQDWLAALDLRDITLVCQDWGGLIGLRLLAAEPERFARVITSNTFLPTGDEPVGEAFEKWRSFSQRVPEFSAGHIVDTATVSTLSESVKAAYDAPFPSEEYKAGARQFPMLVPTRPDDPESQANRDAWERLRHFDRPWLCAFGDSDPVTASGAETFRKLVPGCVGRPHTTIAGAGHFIQEDKGEELARTVLAFMECG
jgi:haloalkane dehalogenase